MRVKVVKEFLGLKIGEIGEVTQQDGKELPAPIRLGRAMWVKFDSKDMPVGICEPFDMHVREVVG